MADHAEMYSELRTRVLAVLAATDESGLDRFTPATPEWTGRDIVAQLSGVCADVVNGRLDGVGSDPWTAAQVDTRRDWPFEQLVAEWEQNGESVEQLIGQIAELPAWRTLVADTVTHEHDIRGALECPGARNSEAVVHIADSAVGLIGNRLEGKQAGSLTIALDDDVPTTVGAGSSHTTLRIPRFELLRTITGRRSASQITAFECDGEPQPTWLVLACSPRAPSR